MRKTPVLSCFALFFIFIAFVLPASAAGQTETLLPVTDHPITWKTDDLLGLGQKTVGVLAPTFQRLIGCSPASKEFEVIITFTHPPLDSTISALKALGITAGIRFQTLPMVAMLARPAQILKVAQWENVLAVSPNRALQYFNSESRAVTQVDRVREDEQFKAWNANLPVTGKGIGVAVVDSGINAAHPDLRLGLRVKENVKILLGPLNNGLGAGLLPLITTPTLCNTDTSSGHGTHVAGIVGGSGAASLGRYAGVATGSDLVGIGVGDAISIIYGLAAFDWVLANHERLNIRIVTNSWGSSGSDEAYANEDGSLTPIYLATKEMVDRNIVVIFAAGNDGGYNILNPYATWEHIIGVAAGTKDGGLAAFSSRGVNSEFESGTKSYTSLLHPTVTAPGQDIISTRAINTILPLLSLVTDISELPLKTLRYYTIMSGTSMAAPHVAGIVALMLEADPALTPQEIKEIITESATPMGKYKPFESGDGYVNAYAALEKVFSRKALLQELNLAYPVQLKPGYLFEPMGAYPQTGRFITGLRTPYPFRDLSCNNLPFTPRTAAVRIHDAQLHNTTSLLTPTGSLWFNDPLGAEAYSTRGDSIISFPRPGQWSHLFRGLLSMATQTGGLELPKKYSFNVTLYNVRLTDNGFAADIAALPSKEDMDIVRAMTAMGQLPEEAGGYNGSRPVMRAELAEALARSVLRKYVSLDSATYTDVPQTHPQYAYIEAASDAGVMTSPEKSGFFEPARTVTRLELAVTAVKAARLQAEAEQYSGAGEFTLWPEESNGNEQPQLISLADIAGLTDEEKGYVAAALKHRLITIDRADSQLSYFSPGANATRHEMIRSVYWIITSLSS